jgi:hypothetical protein
VKGVSLMRKRYKVHSAPERQAHSSFMSCIMLQLFIRKTKCEDMDLGRCNTLLNSVINLWVSLRKAANF